MPKEVARFKIIGVDNFDRDNVSDILLCENMTESWANEICKLVNDKHSNDNASRFYKVVPMSHVLYVWEP